MFYNKWELTLCDGEFVLRLDESDKEDRVKTAQTIHIFGNKAFVYFERKDAEYNEKYRLKILEKVIDSYEKDRDLLAGYLSRLDVLRGKK